MPTDPATIVDRADRLFDFAVTVTGCTTPWIALNELFGAQTPTPWTATTAQYRANTLALVRRLKERGAFPAVTIANPPYTGGEAAQWWRDLAAQALLIRQVFFTAPNIPQLHALGPVRASRAMRSGMRALVAALHRDRDPGEPGRARAPVPVGRRHRRPRGPAAALEVARDRQAAGTRRATGDEGAAHALDLVVGLGDVQRGGDRQGQGRGGLRLPLGARPESLQRTRRRGPGDGCVAYGRAARPARARRGLPASCRADPGDCRGAAGASDRGQGHRRERRARAARAAAGGQAGRPCGARGGARLRRRSLPRQPVRVPRRAEADPADADRGARAAPRRVAARGSAGAVLHRAPSLGCDLGVPPDVRRATGASGRDGPSSRVAGRPESWLRGRDLRSREGLRAARAVAACARSKDGST